MAKLDLNRLPKHIGIIIDGNGRWAKKRGLPRTVGHDAGFDNLKKRLKYAFDLGIDTVSVYCFSTENWNRPQKEVDHLIEIFRNVIDTEFDDILGDNTRLYISGDYTRFPDDLAEKVERLLEKTKNNTGHRLNICINYGSHDEILRAVNNMIKDGVKEVNKEIFNSYLYTADLPPLDLIIRTSGEQRLSNFMLWQAGYAELYFEKVHWPSFTNKHLDKALINFQSRDRRFGAIKEKK